MYKPCIASRPEVIDKHGIHNTDLPPSLPVRPDGCSWLACAATENPFSLRFCVWRILQPFLSLILWSNDTRDKLNDIEYLYSHAQWRQRAVFKRVSPLRCCWKDRLMFWANQGTGGREMESRRWLWLQESVMPTQFFSRKIFALFPASSAQRAGWMRAAMRHGRYFT